MSTTLRTLLTSAAFVTTLAGSALAQEAAEPNTNGGRGGAGNVSLEDDTPTEITAPDKDPDCECNGEEEPEVDEPDDEVEVETPVTRNPTRRSLERGGNGGRINTDPGCIGNIELTAPDTITKTIFYNLHRIDHDHIAQNGATYEPFNSIRTRRVQFPTLDGCVAWVNRLLPQPGPAQVDQAPVTAAARTYTHTVTPVAVRPIPLPRSVTGGLAFCAVSDQNSLIQSHQDRGENVLKMGEGLGNGYFGLTGTEATMYGTVLTFDQLANLTDDATIDQIAEECAITGGEHYAMFNFEDPTDETTPVDAFNIASTCLEYGQNGPTENGVTFLSENTRGECNTEANRLAYDVNTEPHACLEQPDLSTVLSAIEKLRVQLDIQEGAQCSSILKPKAKSSGITPLFTAESAGATASALLETVISVDIPQATPGMPVDPDTSQNRLHNMTFK